MAGKTTWIDPNTGKVYSYDWGFNTNNKVSTSFTANEEEMNIMGNANQANYFGWRVESIHTIDEGLEVDIIGIPKEECGSFRFNPDELANAIDDRMNAEVNMKETTNPYVTLLAKTMLNSIYGTQNKIVPSIKDVIFNPPATVVFWTDGSKTVVKCQNNEEFDPEKGITMAFFKKMHGNKGSYFDEIKKLRDKYDKTAANKTEKSGENHKWYILYRIGSQENVFVYDTVYTTKYNAIRDAKKMFCDASHNVSWTVVSKKDALNPNRDVKDAKWNHNP